jgi:hypothetical protein
MSLLCVSLFHDDDLFANKRMRVEVAGTDIVPEMRTQMKKRIDFILVRHLHLW